MVLAFLCWELLCCESCHFQWIWSVFQKVLYNFNQPLQVSNMTWKGRNMCIGDVGGSPSLKGCWAIQMSNMTWKGWWNASCPGSNFVVIRYGSVVIGSIFVRLRPVVVGSVFVSSDGSSSDYPGILYQRRPISISMMILSALLKCWLVNGGLICEINVTLLRCWSGR